MAVNAPNPLNTPTGGNTTRLVLDSTEYVQLDDAWGGSRYYFDVGKTAMKQTQYEGDQAYRVTQWASGCITNAPLPSGLYTEKALPIDATFQPKSVVDAENETALVILTAAVQQHALWNSGGITGLTASASTAPKGNLFFQRAIAAGTSFSAATGDFTGATAASLAPSISGFGAVLAAPSPSITNSGVLTPLSGQAAPPIPTDLTQPLIPVAQMDGYADADQGFELRWMVPGTRFTTNDVSSVFFFGGVAGIVHPQYSLTIKGDGTCDLREYAQQAVGGEYNWYSRKSFQYCRPSEVCDTAHALQIFPHVGTEGQKYISFRTGNLDYATSTTGGNGTTTKAFYTQDQALTETLYKWDPISAGTLDGSPLHSTGEGSFVLVERADIRAYWQINYLRFAPVGTFIDDPWALSIYDSGRNFTSDILGQIAVISTNETGDGGWAALGYTPLIQATLRDSMNIGGPDVTNSSASASKSVVPIFKLQGTCYKPSILWGYKLTLPSTTLTVAPGAFVPLMRNTAITGPEGDPRSESAHCAIDDPAFLAPRLKNRGSFPARIETDIPQVGGGTKTVVLFRGSTERPPSLKKGRQGRKNGIGGGGTTAMYPNPEWRHYELQFTGMWKRLSEITMRTVLTSQYFRFDINGTPDPKTGMLPGFKITDAVRYLLSRGGFPDSMINIPDINFRIYPGIGISLNEWIHNPQVSVADFIVTLVRNWLGMFLYFDPNAGTVVNDLSADKTASGTATGSPIGQWKLLTAPPLGATPLINFVTQTSMPSTGAPAPWVPGSQGANTYYAYGDLEGYTVPPEANQILVCTAFGTGGASTVRVDNVMCNPLSANFPGFTVQADPNSPHYLGRPRPIIVPEPSLWGGDGPNGPQYTQSAVDFTVARLFQASCLPRFIQPVTSQFATVTDPTSGTIRPPRFYDPASFNSDSSFYIRNCNVSVEHSVAQTMHCQLEKIIQIPTTGS